MIHILQGRALARQPNLVEGMFRDRAAQFVDRLEWDISIDAEGREIDQYDRLDPIYLIIADGEGRHAGSMRFLPTFGRTMLSEHFAHLIETPFEAPNVWECTRLCIRPGAPADTSRQLLSAALELGLSRGWAASVGVFDARMMRVYARIGWAPELLARGGTGRDALCLGRWTFEPRIRAALAPAEERLAA